MRPTSDQVLTVVNNLKKVLPTFFRRRRLNMQNGIVCNNGNCHAGWYYIASKGKPRTAIDFYKGADLIAIDLGFQRHNQIEEFFTQNPEIWGNRNARKMFFNTLAFCSDIKRPKGAKTIQDIVDHWTEVYERIKKLEEEEKAAKKPEVVKVEYVSPSEKLDVILEEEMV